MASTIALTATDNKNKAFLSFSSPWVVTLPYPFLVDAVMPLDSLQLPDYAREWANDLLVYVGFGTLVGLVAKGIMPGRDPGGSVATVVMGIVGTLMGCGMISYYYGERVTVIGPVGFVVGTVGAFTILALYRLIGGYFFIEGGHPIRRYRSSYRRRRRYYNSAYYDD